MFGDSFMQVICLSCSGIMMKLILLMCSLLCSSDVKFRDILKTFKEKPSGQPRDKLRKTVVSKLSLAVGAMIEGRTPNTVELANLLPLETERQDMREQWLRRLLKNPLLQGEAVMEPLARQELEEAARNGQVVPSENSGK